MRDMGWWSAAELAHLSQSIWTLQTRTGSILYYQNRNTSPACAIGRFPAGHHIHGIPLRRQRRRNIHRRRSRLLISHSLNRQRIRSSRERWRCRSRTVVSLLVIRSELSISDGWAAVCGDLVVSSELGGGSAIRRFCRMPHRICCLHSVDTLELEQPWLSEQEFIGASCELRDDL